MTRDEFEKWVRGDGTLKVSGLPAYVHVRALRSAWVGAGRPADPWPRWTATLLSRLLWTYDVSVGFTVHETKPADPLKLDTGDLLVLGSDTDTAVYLVAGMQSWRPLAKNVKFLQEAADRVLFL